MPWTDAARRLVIRNSRSWRQAAQALGIPVGVAQHEGQRLDANPDPTVPKVRLATARKTPPTTPGKQFDAAELIEIGNRLVEGAPTRQEIHAFGWLLRKGHVVVREDGSLLVDHRLMRKLRPRGPQSDGLSYAERVHDRDQAIIAAAKAHIPMDEIARRFGMTRWGATLVLRRHGFEFTRIQDRPEIQERRQAVQAAMRTAPSITALAHQVGIPVGIATYLVRQIDPTWSARRTARNLAERQRLQRERIQRLRMALACRQRTMAEVSRAAGIRRTQLSQVLVYGVRPADLPAVARELEVPLAWLADGDGSAPRGCGPKQLRAWQTGGFARMRADDRERRRTVETALRRYRTLGWSTTRIAGQVGCRADYVRRCARRLGLPARRTTR
jgi:hypothetical protein